MKAAVLRLKKASESKVTEEPSAVVIGQNEEPSTSQVKVMDTEVMWPPQSEPQPSTSQVKVVDTEVIRQQKEPQPSASQVKDDEKRKDNGQRVKLSQNRINGLILKLLSHISVSVTSVTKDIGVLSSKMDKLTETFSSKISKVTETFGPYSDPNFGFNNDFCMT